MPIYEIVFYVFSFIMLGAAVAVISVRNPVYAALFLVLAFFSASAIWMLLEVEFLAIILILVYVGAVMVLFLFVVMMLDINVEPLRAGFIRYLPLGLLVAAVMAAEFLLVIWTKGRFGENAFPVPSPAPVEYSNTKAVGEWLYTNRGASHHGFPITFGITAGIIILTGLATLVRLVLKHPVPTKVPSEQV